MVCMFYRDNTGWQLEGGVQNIDDLHSVKEDYHSSAGTTWDILDLVRLESGLHVGEGREKLDMVQGGAHSNSFSFHIIS